MSVLLEGEMENLLKIRTSVKDARLIKKRFQWVLNNLDKPDRTSPLGCPHCSCDFCSQCSYFVIPFSDQRENPCLSVPFGGVIFWDIVHIIQIGSDFIGILATPKTPEEREQVEVWAKGHIEWANAVLARAKKRAKSKE
jgi:hypothetical protein